MPAEVRVPELGESIVEATVSRWLKREGDPVAVGELLVELETDKVNQQITADGAGVLGRILHGDGETVHPGDVLATIGDGAAATGGEAERSPDGAVPAAPPTREATGAELERSPGPGAASRTPPPAPPPRGEGSPGSVTGASRLSPMPPAGAPSVGTRPVGEGGLGAIPSASKLPPMPPKAQHPAPAGVRASPLAERVAEELHVDLTQVPVTHPSGRLTREDVEAYARQQVGTAAGSAGGTPTLPDGPVPSIPHLQETRERLSRRRLTIARRLVEAQQTAAMLTTFNEVDMSAVMALRAKRRDAFKERHGVNLGYMSFFSKATVAALKAFPNINAELEDDELVLKRHYDLGIAIGDPEGLVVPVVRDVDRLTFAEIERAIAAFAQKAKERTLSVEDLRGGTFTITNGGTFGSLLSTPILNPPQVGILGMHKIQERPVAVDGQVVVRPMMYLALTYDHRVVDGREAVQFLVRVKEGIEDPGVLLIEG